MKRENQVGEHICLLYSDLTQQVKNVFPFLKEGLSQGERVIYIASRARTKLIKEELLKFDLETFGKAFDKEAILILDYQATYLRGDRFNSEKMLVFIKKSKEEAIELGFSGLRGSAEMSWVFEGMPGSESLIEYEAKLSQFLQKNQIPVICQYNLNEFGVDLKHSILHTHPYIRVEGQTIPCEQWLGNVSDRH